MTGSVQAAIGTMAGKRFPSLSNTSINGSVASPTIPWAAVGLFVDGSLRSRIGTGTFPTGSVTTNRLPQWCGFSVSPSSSYGNDFQCRLDVQSGDAPSAGSASVGVWIGLNAPVEWLLQGVASPGTRSGVWRISVRELFGLTVFADYTMTAISVPP